MVGDYHYVIGFPTAGGSMEKDRLDCVLFDRIMLEHKKKTKINNYLDLEKLLEGTKIKAEKPNDMVEWIWIHMAINAAVTTTAGREGKLENPKQLAINLMDSSKALSEGILSIRETLKIVEARGVNMGNYLSEIIPYKIQRHFAGVLMKRLFKNNELTRRIMTLHNDIDDILYGCNSVFETGKALDVKAPNFYSNMNRILKIYK